MRTMTMRQGALLAWRSPPSCALTRPLFLPEPLGMGGHTAEVGPGAFRVEPFGVVASRHHEGGRGVRSDPEELEEVGHGGHRGSDLSLSSAARVEPVDGTTTVMPWWQPSLDQESDWVAAPFLRRPGRAPRGL